MTIFLLILATPVAIYLIGYVLFVFIIFIQHDHKFGGWRTIRGGINWIKLHMALMCALVWPVLLIPEKRK